VLVAQLVSQVHWISKVNGLLAKDLSLVSKHKTELLAASCDDRWFARFMNRMIEVTLQIDQRDSSADRNVLDKVRLFDIDTSGLKFDRADRLWIVNTDGFVEILDIRRSCLQLTPHRYFLSKVHEKTTHSSRVVDKYWER
jgi:ligand-binding sensor domain-containing protein